MLFSELVTAFCDHAMIPFLNHACSVYLRPTTMRGVSQGHRFNPSALDQLF